MGWRTGGICSVIRSIRSKVTSKWEAFFIIHLELYTWLQETTNTLTLTPVLVVMRFFDKWLSISLLKLIIWKLNNRNSLRSKQYPCAYRTRSSGTVMQSVRCLNGYIPQAIGKDIATQIELGDVFPLCYAQAPPQPFFDCSLSFGRNGTLFHSLIGEENSQCEVTHLLLGRTILNSIVQQTVHQIMYTSEALEERLMGVRQAPVSSWSQPKISTLKEAILQSFIHSTNEFILYLIDAKV